MSNKNIIALFREWLKERTYPEDVRTIIHNKRIRIRYHKKKLKNIKKYGNGGHPCAYQRHKYMVKKLRKEVEGIKNHYENNKLNSYVSKQRDENNK